MGWWRVNADTLAGSRFVLCALAEATASLMALERGTATHPGERAWLDTHQPGYQERLAGDQITALLIRAALGRNWIADFLTPTPMGEGEQAFGNELARIRETPAEAVRADLTVSLSGPLPARLRRSDLAERTADLLEWVWTESVLPYWPRRRRIAEGCAGLGRAVCRSTRMTTHHGRSPGRSCCSSPSPRAMAGRRGTRRTGTP